ncbi:hypothetical protein EYE42_02565 [Paracoccus subflavus]|uniref:Uncharacterized protein n=1 Tax=Paracoccus subflavus TaxID=2528244 RepID=A0A4V2JCV5_9RHOB|nr:hypothetical protein [Paracoccus subflavus]TBN44021.1 hypothetical protein EYE42_02565 [Paracoccus subflavus]
MIPKPAMIATAVAGVIAVALTASFGLQAQGTPATPPRIEAPRLMPGDVLRADQVRIIENPGQYGLGSGVRGSRYAIAEGHLIRIGPKSLRVQSVIRTKVRPVD